MECMEMYACLSRNNFHSFLTPRWVGAEKCCVTLQPFSEFRENVFKLRDSTRKATVTLEPNHQKIIGN